MQTWRQLAPKGIRRISSMAGACLRHFRNPRSEQMRRLCLLLKIRVSLVRFRPWLPSFPLPFPAILSRSCSSGGTRLEHLGHRLSGCNYRAAYGVTYEGDLIRPLGLATRNFGYAEYEIVESHGLALEMRLFTFWSRYGDRLVGLRDAN